MVVKDIANRLFPLLTQLFRHAQLAVRFAQNIRHGLTRELLDHRVDEYMPQLAVKPAEQIRCVLSHAAQFTLASSQHLARPGFNRAVHAVHKNTRYFSADVSQWQIRKIKKHIDQHPVWPQFELGHHRLGLKGLTRAVNLIQQSRKSLLSQLGQYLHEGFPDDLWAAFDQV